MAAPLRRLRLLAAGVAIFCVAPALGEEDLESVIDVGAPEQVSDAAVLVLGKANFDETLSKHKRVLVEFYAPWCGHCKALQPEWNQAAADIKVEGLSTVLAKVDTTVEQELAKQYKIEGLPTILYFVQGEREPQTYQGATSGNDPTGGRNAAAIKKWVRARELPLITEIPEDGLESFLAGLEDKSFALVARVARKSARAKAFWKAVEGYLGPLVDGSIANLAAVKFGVAYLPKGSDPKGNTTLVMFRPHFEEPDKKVYRFEGKWVADKIVEFAKGSLYPLVGKSLDMGPYALYSQEAMENNGKEGMVAVAVPMLSDNSEDKERQQLVVEALAPLAREEPNWVFTMAFRRTDEIDAGALHSIAVTKGTKKYVQKVEKEPAGSEEVKKLLESVKAGEAKPFHKSAAVPAETVDAEGVTVLVGSTFEKYVMDTKKDVFVEFYAPWCGHCQKLAPVWAELAQRAKAEGWADRNVVIAKMDGSENECDEEISGFPLLVFYPAVKAERKFRLKQTYGGLRELEPLSDFVLEQAKNLEGFEIGGNKKQFNQVQRDLARKKKRAEL